MRVFFIVLLFWFPCFLCQRLSAQWEELGPQRIAQTRRSLEQYGPVWREKVVKNDILDAETLLSVLAKASLSGLATECFQDVSLLAEAFHHFGGDNVPNATIAFQENVLMPVIDAAGKIGPAILRGHLQYDGHLTECLKIEYAVEGRMRNFLGGYFQVSVDAAFRNNSDPKACGKDGQGAFFTFGACLPLSCSSHELQEIFRPTSEPPPFPNAVCSVKKLNDDVLPKDAPFWAVLIFMCVVAGISIITGLVDFFLSEYLAETEIVQTLPWKLLMSFSLYANVSSIFDVGGLNKDGQIGPLHCIRFFSMTWVILGHLASVIIAMMSNPLDVMTMTKDIATEVITNAYIAVDSFLFLSGVLLSFIWFKNYKKAPEAMISPLSWVLFYVHRILRLSPAYYVATLFYTFVLKQWLSDVPLNMSSMYTQDFCRTTFWIDLLYLHNFVKQDKVCMGFSWYLAAEMQIFIFTPLLLIPLALKPVLGWIVAGGLLALSTATNIFLMYFYHWPSNGGFIYPRDPEESHVNLYFKLMYSAPYIRCQIYIIGMLVGWIMQYKRTLRMHRVVNLVGWVVAFSVMLAVLLGLHDQSNGVYVDVFWRAMYSALSRLGWGLGLSWIVLACWYGHGGIVNAFTSWYIWAPLGRLSYCAYLIHIPTMMLLLAQSTDGIVFTTFFEMFITRILPIIVISFAVSIVWSALFEISFGKVEMNIIATLKSSSGKRRIVHGKQKDPDSELTAAKDENWS